MCCVWDTIIKRMKGSRGGGREEPLLLTSVLLSLFFFRLSSHHLLYRDGIYFISKMIPQRYRGHTRRKVIRGPPRSIFHVGVHNLFLFACWLTLYGCLPVTNGTLINLYSNSLSTRPMSVLNTVIENTIPPSPLLLGNT